MTYCNYGPGQLRNENRGMGRRGEVDEATKTKQRLTCLKKYLGSCPDSDLDVYLFLMDLFFQDVLCSLAILLNLTSFLMRRAADCCCNSSARLLLTQSMCLFYLATDSL